MALPISPSVVSVRTDPRATELRELAATEGLKIAIAIDMVLWLEDRGFVVDLHSGVAMKVSIERVTPSGRAVNHLLSPVTEDEIEQTVNGLFSHVEEDCAPDGTLQAMIDHGQAVSDYEDYLADIDFWRHHR